MRELTYVEAVSHILNAIGIDDPKTHAALLYADQQVLLGYLASIIQCEATTKLLEYLRR